MDGLILTRESLLRLLKASPVADVGLALTTWRKAAQRAKKAGFVDGAGQEHPPAPDHGVRIKAADYLVKFHGAYPADTDTADPNRPIAIVINLAGHTNGTNGGAAIQADGIRLHLGRGDRG